MPILYQKTPQTLLRDLSKSKERVKTKGREEDIRPKKEEQCPEQISPENTLKEIEKWLFKACGSTRVIKGLRESAVVRKFFMKLS